MENTMPLFNDTDKSTLETAIKNAANDLRILLDKVKQVVDTAKKGQLAKEAWSEYNITMRSLSALYKAQPKDQKIEDQLVVYKKLGQEAIALTKENLSPERKKQLKDINDAIDRRIGQNQVAESGRVDVSAAAIVPPPADIVRPWRPLFNPTLPLIDPMQPLPQFLLPLPPTRAAIVPPPPAAIVPPPAAIASEVIVDAKVRNGQIAQVNKILDELNGKITEINKNAAYSQRTKDVANTLIKELYQVRDDLKRNLPTDAFISRSKYAIDKAKTILINDLSWGDYLQNILKSLANAVVKIGSLGFHNGFFELKKTEYAPLLEHAEHDLTEAAPQVAAWPSYLWN